MLRTSVRNSLPQLRALTDRQVVTTLSNVTLCERSAMAKAISLLAEFDQRKLHLPLGYTSSFAYCTTKLGLSQDEAFLRIKAARIARKFPVVLDYIESGSINLTNLKLLVPHLTGDNHVALLKAASHQKVPAVEMLVARLKPKPDIPSTIRKLPALEPRTPTSSSQAGAEQAAAVANNTATTALPPQSASAARSTDGAPLSAASSNRLPGWPATDAAPTGTPLTEASGPAAIEQAAMSGFGWEQIRARRPIIQPLSEVSYRLQITLAKDTHDTLRQIQGLIRHIIPSGDPAAIVARALDLLLLDLKRKKAAHVRSPRPARSQMPRGRGIPAHVKRRVWARDSGRCAFVSADGVRCDSDGFVEFHHVKPYARGGRATAENIQLRCRAHNAHEAAIAGLARQG